MAGTLQTASEGGVPAGSVSDVIERTVRESYGRLVAYLAARSGDVAGAEDCLSEAFLAALKQWPGEGLPQKPEAWLLAAARRKMIDNARHDEVRQLATEALQIAVEAAPDGSDTAADFPDERLKLLFVCAHPAIDPAARTPLMLQTVLHLEAADIAAAFLTSTVAMSQRLVRAKLKIREAGIPFVVPGPAELPERSQDVLNAIYAAFTSDWSDSTGDVRDGLASEAVWLSRVAVQVMPDEPEALGLLALLLFCQARVTARSDAQGLYVPLPHQDTSRWDLALVREAEDLLTRASTHRNIGRYQLEAAIQSVHCQRAITGVTEWPAIAFLYRGLLAISPSAGAQVGHAIALSYAVDPAAGLQALAAIPRRLIADYQPYWASEAHLLARTGQRDQARAAYRRAIALSQNAASRNFLIAQAARLEHEQNRDDGGTLALRRISAERNSAENSLRDER